MTPRTDCASADNEATNVIKPQFSPGQSLSDKDLGAIVSWAEQRFRLHPTSCDWGIVCGLTVGVDPKIPSNVTVGPGYGFDSNRDLCIVHAPLHESLCAAACAGCGAADDNMVTIPGPGPIEGRRFSGRDLRVYDVKLSTNDCPQHKTLVLSLDGRRACKETRLKTWGKVTIVPATNAVTPPDPAQEFLETLGADAQLGNALNGGAWPIDFSTTMNTWLTNELKHYPAFELPWSTLPKNWGDLSQALTHLSWLVFGLRRLRACRGPARDPSIPLARIWAVCKGGVQDIVWIDASMPQRRVLDCAPCGFKLRDWIGERFGDAEAAAKAWQITLKRSDESVHPNKLDDLQTQVKDEIALGKSIAPKAILTAHCYKAPRYELNNGKPNINIDGQRIFACTAAPAIADP